MCGEWRGALVLSNNSETAKEWRIRCCLPESAAPTEETQWKESTDHCFERIVRADAGRTVETVLSFTTDFSGAQHNKIHLYITDALTQAVWKEELEMGKRDALLLDVSEKGWGEAREEARKEKRAPVDNPCGTSVYVIKSDWIMDETVALDHTFSHIVMHEGKSIVVKAGARLTLNNVLLSSCSGVWKGIFVEPGGSLSMHNSFIENAPPPVYLKPKEQSLSLTVTPNPAADVLHIRFGNNGIATNIIQEITLWDEAGHAHPLPFNALTESGAVTTNVNGFAAGMYQLSARMQDGQLLHTSVVINRY